MLYAEVQRQATMLAFNDIYRIVAIALIPLIPLFFAAAQPEIHRHNLRTLSRFCELPSTVA